MAVLVSPLDLLLDSENPRFVVLSKRDQADIRKYLLTYEDVCPLASAINSYGSLLPGERIVVLYENGRYVVVEGNRRTCSLQLLLNRELIPDGFGHKIPTTSEKIITNCQEVEVDLLPDRNSALELMTKRHIEGVKQWKPIAKKQFFAANYQAGQSVQNLSRITGIREGEIKEDIRDYKFFLSAFDEYRRNHPDFVQDIIELKTDPFWRMFKAKFDFPIGTRVAPSDVLQISCDEEFNTHSALGGDLFSRIEQLVFENAIVTETVNTRNVLTDIDGIMPLLEKAVGDREAGDDEPNKPPTDTPPSDIPPTSGNPPVPPETNGEGSSLTPNPQRRNGGGSSARPTAGGPVPGGPSPRAFFETISWHGKIDPTNQEHHGLLVALAELHRLSTASIGRQRSYVVFPVATGMVLRAVYEQALRLRLKQVNLWGNYCATLRPGTFPTLNGMELFINQGANKNVVFPDHSLLLIYDRVIAATHREFLNANIHFPEGISVTADTLEGIAAAGMYALIQGIINLA